jgi:ubiquinone/menaquinone biosynthesis C-methylase UbiE
MMATQNGKPAYSQLLDAYHRAHEHTLRRAIFSLPLRTGECALDVCCGDGFYCRLLAERVGDCGRVVGVDRSTPLLGEARRRHQSSCIEYQEADAYRLPLNDDCFDVVWCAQSFISLQDAPAALREMRRVLKTGCSVAVLENDELHHTLLPWPPQLELALHQAARAARIDQQRSPDKLSIGRYVRRLLGAADFRAIERTTFVTDHQPPLSPASRRFLDLHFASLRTRLRRQLNKSQRSLFDRLTDPASADYLPRQGDFEACCIDVLTVGKK